MSDTKIAFEELSRTTLNGLLGEGSGPRLSLYLPTHRFGPEAEADRAILGTCLVRAEELLAAEGSSEDEIRSLLKPVRALLDDTFVWKHLSEGLAIFVAPEEMHLVRAAVHFPQEVTLGSRFRLAPLVPALPRTEHYFVLALSMGATRLVEVSPGEAVQVRVPGMPETMDDALDYDQFQSEVQVHSAGPRRLGSRQAFVHGHGDDDEERRERDLLAYFRLVADGLKVRVGDVPVILASVEEYYPIFRKANSSCDLLTGIAGSPDHLTDRQLADAALAVLELRAEERIREALEQYRELGDRRRVSDDAAEIVQAALQGRMDTLFVAPGMALWGTFEPDLGRVAFHQDRQPGDDDLVDLAVVRTLGQGGEVMSVPADRVPGGGPLAAILRYGWEAAA